MSDFGNPIDGIEQSTTVTFWGAKPVTKIGDASFDVILNYTGRMSSEITGYPVESGFTITNGQYRKPFSLSMNLIIAEYEYQSLFSNPVQSLQQNWSGYLGGLASNVSDSGLVSYVGGLLNNSRVQQQTRRAGQALLQLQAYQSGGKALDIELSGVGLFLNMRVKDIQFSKSVQTGKSIYFTLTFEQLQTVSFGTKQCVVDASGTVDTGEATIVEEEIFTGQ